MSSRLKALALALATLLVLPLILAQATPALAQVKGPAVDRVEWFRVNIPDVPAAITTGKIDLYIFGRLPAAMAESLAATPGIRIVTAPAGLTDLVLNPAPVQILKFPGRESKETAALKLGVNPLLIRYVKYIEAERKTEVELCGVVDVPRGVEEVFRADKVNFNPFCIREIRFELQYVFDRERIAREVYRGFALVKYTFYGPDDPTYADLADVIAKYAFEYNFERAKRNIEDIMRAVGADLIGGKWHYRGQRVDIIGIIRVEDERLEIGRSFALELVKLGFNVIPSELTFGPAIGIVYGTNPIDFQWHFYTEGWGKGVLDRYDEGNLAQFGADVLGYLPGWGEAEYWNYKHELTIDGRNASDYARDAYYMNVKSKEEWLEALRRGTDLAIRESIRIWGFATLDRWPVRAEVQGLTIDLGAGLRSPLNCRGWFVPGRTDIKVGHLWVWTATTVWNTFRGFRDVYSVDPARCTHDFVVWRHPFTGMPIPFRAKFTVETAGPDGKLKVPDDALWFDVKGKTWVYARELGRTEATSKVVFDMSRFLGAKWHNGQTITWADLLGTLALYLDAVYDPEKAATERAFVAVNKEDFDTFVAVRPVGNNLEVYINYWHFEPAYIAEWAAIDTRVPFELVVAQTYAGYIAKEFALDLARARAENLPWLSLALKAHAEKVAGYFKDGSIKFDDFKSYVTTPAGALMTPAEWDARVRALLSWFDKTSTLWVSNGPYMLTYYSSEEQKLILEAFRDPTYPFGPRDWVFGEAKPVAITKIEAPLVPVGGPAKIVVRAEAPGVITVKYVIRDPVTKAVITSGVAKSTAEGFVVELPETITNLLNPFAVYEVLVIAYSTEIALPTEVIARIQTVPAGFVQEITAIGQSVEELGKNLAAVQADLLRRMEELRGSLSAELAASIKALSDALTESISAIGKATSDAITRIGSDVERGFKRTDD
ncbi:MAG: ABC transporter substrate-binding protein, partial [Acidilobaceae archaeon]